MKATAVNGVKIMKHYEVTFVTRPDMSRNDVQKLTDSLSAIVTENGGSVAKAEYWGIRTLAYRIQKTNKGHYTMLGITAPFAALAELERQISINEDIIRTLTVKVDSMDATPSVMLQQKSGDSYEAA
jgi:small subunit ribosomal protein S6